MSIYVYSCVLSSSVLDSPSVFTSVRILHRFDGCEWCFTARAPTPGRGTPPDWSPKRQADARTDLQTCIFHQRHRAEAAAALDTLEVEWRRPPLRLLLGTVPLHRCHVSPQRFSSNTASCVFFVFSFGYMPAFIQQQQEGD